MATGGPDERPAEGPPPTAARVRRIRADEWPELRDLRLAALAEAPGAFASLLDVEAGFADDVWRDRARGGSSSPATATFVAERRATAGDQWVGLATGVLNEDGTEAELYSVWVAPRARRQGVAVRLVEAVAVWAQAAGASAVSLWVARDNGAASELYRRCGFLPTGLEGPFPNHPDTIEVQLSRSVTLSGGNGGNEAGRLAGPG